MDGLFGFTHAIARTPGRTVVNGLRNGADDDPVFEAVLAEHVAYVGALRSSGVEVELLAPAEDYPDSVFIEDAALVFEEGAILLKSGAKSREGEAALIAPVLDRCFSRVLVLAEGRVDGGDVLVTPGGGCDRLVSQDNSRGCRSAWNAVG